MKKYLLFMLILSIVFLAGCGQLGEQSVSVEVVEPAEEDPVGSPNSEIVPAGNSPYLRFNKENYDESVAEGKLILLEYYASWCPICAKENPQIRAAIAELKEPNVVAYQVHILDGETNAEDKEIARKFGVTLQHTKVIVKDGEQVDKSLESWDKEETLNRIRKFL